MQKRWLLSIRKAWRSINLFSIIVEKVFAQKLIFCIHLNLKKNVYLCTRITFRNWFKIFAWKKQTKIVCQSKEVIRPSDLLIFFVYCF